MKYGYVIGNPVKIGVLSGHIWFRKNIPDSEIAASYIKEGKVKVFATEEEAAKYARSKRDDFSEVTQPAYFYVEINDGADADLAQKQKTETCHTDVCIADSGFAVISPGFTHEASYYEMEATELTPIRGNLSKNVRFSVELTAEGNPLQAASRCAIV